MSARLGPHKLKATRKLSTLHMDLRMHSPPSIFKETLHPPYPLSSISFLSSSSHPIGYVSFYIYFLENIFLRDASLQFLVSCLGENQIKSCPQSHHVSRKPRGTLRCMRHDVPLGGLAVFPWFLQLTPSWVAHAHHLGYSYKKNAGAGLGVLQWSRGSLENFSGSLLGMYVVLCTTCL